MTPRPDPRKRIVITGVGVLASNGIGKDEFWGACEAGRTGIKEVTLFDTSSMTTKTAGEIRDFDAKIYLGEKGLRLLDRSTKLVNTAAKFALEDAAFAVTAENTDRTGVVVGTTLGSIWSISEFDKTALIEGPRYVNPALFPNTVINSPASQISIRFVIKGFNTTIATGFTSTMDALKYACDFIRWDRADAVLVGGVEEMCIQTYLGFYTLKFLSGSNPKKKGPELSCPFDKRRNGIVFGEGAAMFLIESLEHAQARKANILAEVTALGYAFDPFRINKYNRRGPGIRAAYRATLEDGGFKPRDIGYISANANSTLEADQIEAEAIQEVFGESAGRVPVSSIKSMTGETFSACGGLQLASAVGVVTRGVIPPTIHLDEPDPKCALDHVAGCSRKKDVQNALVSCFGPSGSNSCAVISQFKE